MSDGEEVRLPSSPESVPAARRFVARLLPQWLTAESRDRAVLAVSEIVSNAIRASGEAVTVRLFRRRPAVRIEVDDDDHTPADLTPRQAGDDAESGRGLFLVDAVTDSWGVIQHPDDGKTVWFHIAEPDQRDTSSANTSPAPEAR